MSYPKHFYGFILPVHVHLKTDKLDYLGSPSFYFVFFSFKTASSSPGKWNWHRLSFLPLLLIFEQCAKSPIVMALDFKYQFLKLFIDNICLFIDISLLQKKRSPTSNSKFLVFPNPMGILNQKNLWPTLIYQFEHLYHCSRTP